MLTGVFVDPGPTVSVTDALGNTFTQVAHQAVANDHDANVFVGTTRASYPAFRLDPPFQYYRYPDATLRFAAINQKTDSWHGGLNSDTSLARGA